MTTNVLINEGNAEKTCKKANKTSSPWHGVYRLFVGIRILFRTTTCLHLFLLLSFSFDLLLLNCLLNTLVLFLLLRHHLFLHSLLSRSLAFANTNKPNILKTNRKNQKLNHKNSFKQHITNRITKSAILMNAFDTFLLGLGGQNCSRSHINLQQSNKKSKK